MMRGLYRVGCLLAVAASFSGLALGQDQATRERQALKRAQQQAQKAAKDLAGVQEKLTTIEAEKAKVTEELGGIKASLQTQSGRAATLQKQLLAMTEERDTLKQQSIEQRTASEQIVQGLNTRLSQLERELSLALEQGKKLEAVRAGQVQQMAACEDRNARLYAVGRSVVDECRDRSARDTSLRLEPFTGIARVEIENRLEAQRDQLDAQKSQPANSAK
jgi:DNA repair exonuclease SbcCD ATPase subunit